MNATLLVCILLAQTPPPTPAPPASPPPPPPVAAAAATASSPWSATVGLGLIWLTGNTKSITMTGNVAATRTSPGWIFGLKASGTYGQSQGDEDAAAQVLALKAALELRGDKRFGKKVSAYVLGGAETDHVKSVEVRGLGELGASYFWVDRKIDASELFFRTDLGVRYTRELRFQYFPTPLNLPDIYLVTPRLGLEFRVGKADGVSFIQTAEVMTNVAGESHTLYNSLSKLSVHLVGGLAIGLSFNVAYDSAPATGKVPTDTSTSLQLDYTL